MKPCISEFSYGYAITDELLHRQGVAVTAAPVFPSLYQEGQVGGGYDVKIEGPATPLFIQFKLSDCLKNRSATEFKEGYLDVPFYRMHIRPLRTSNQHLLLMELEAQGEDVYYCAPCFHQHHELNDAYLSQTVCARSIWINPSEIGKLPNTDDHHVSFQNYTDGYFYFCSVPEKRECKGSFSAMVGRLEKRLRTTQFDRQVSDLEQRLLILSQKLQNSEWVLSAYRKYSQDRSPLQRAAFLARTCFDSELYIVRPRETA